MTLYVDSISALCFGIALILAIVVVFMLCVYFYNKGYKDGAHDLAVCIQEYNCKE